MFQWFQTFQLFKRSEALSLHAFKRLEHLELSESGGIMLSKIQHVAIVSENFVREAKFFKAVLGMRRSKPGSPKRKGRSRPIMPSVSATATSA